MSDHSWYPIDLAAIPPEPPTLPCHGRPLYPGARHLLSGEPEAGKGLLGLFFAIAELRDGNTVAWVDRESDEAFLAERLRCFGVDGDELQRFAYFRPTDPIGTAGAAEAVATFLQQRQPAVVVFDAFAGLADLHGLDSWKTGDVEHAYRLVIEPWRTHGAAIVVIDHVVKSKGDRGRFAAGSERKLGAVDVHIGLELIDPFGRGRAGRAKITIHKDRHGFLPRPVFGCFALASDDDGRVTRCAIEPEIGGEGWRPTTLMQKVSAYLERQQEPVSRSAIARDVTGKRDYLLQAVDFLITDGFAGEDAGPRGARLVHSVKPYTDPSPPGGEGWGRVPGPMGATLPPFPGVYTGNGEPVAQAEQERLEALGEEMGL